MKSPHPDSVQRLTETTRRRILILDGAMGTMIQQLGLDEADYRGRDLADHPRDLKGCNDLLSVTRPDAITAIHRAYLDAGADILSTNTFNANRISLADYGLSDHVRRINWPRSSVPAGRRKKKGGRRKEEENGERRPEAPRSSFLLPPASFPLVAGSIGPTNRTASLSPNVSDPGYRAVTFDDLVAAYYEQVAALVEGGVDILLPETVFDTLNLKACLFAIEKYFEERGVRLPVMVSVTITDRSGRTLSGQTLEAFCTSIDHADLLSVGINCALGPELMRPLRRGTRRSGAGLHELPPERRPAQRIRRPTTRRPSKWPRVLGEFAANGWLNIVGGCCGTTPAHIRAIAAAVAGCPPRKPPRAESAGPLQRPGAPRAPAGKRLHDDRRADQRVRLAGLCAAGPRGAAGGGGGRGPAAGRRGGERHRREPGRRPSGRRGRDAPLPQSAGRRARRGPRAGDDRQLQVVDPGGGAEVRAGEGDRQFDQPEGRRGGVPAPGPAGPPLRGGLRGDDVRRSRARPSPSSTRCGSPGGPIIC